MAQLELRLCIAILLWGIFHGTICSRGSEPESLPQPHPDGAQDSSPASTPHNIPLPPLKPAKLLPNQCSFGIEHTDAVASAETDYAEANTLYVLANDPAGCSGIIHSVELCFYVTEAVSSHAIQFLSFWLQASSASDGQVYRKRNAVSTNIYVDVNASGGDAFCQTIADRTLSLNEGEVLGFATKQGFNIALVASDNRDIFQYVPTNEQQKAEPFSVQDASDLKFIPTVQLLQANITAIPALKITMSMSFSFVQLLNDMCSYPDITERSSQVFPTPTSMPNPDPNQLRRCSTISMFMFTSVVVTSVVIIVALIVVIFILSCCLCGCCVCCAGGDCRPRSFRKECIISPKGTQKGSTFVLLSILLCHVLLAHNITIALAFDLSANG